MAKVRRMTGDGYHNELRFMCPGCKEPHLVFDKHSPDYRAQWAFNEDFDKPTFVPSILISYPLPGSIIPHVCHSFIKDGFIQFLGDCTHELANTTVPLPEFE